MATTNSIEAWTALETTVSRWFHEPDFLAIRASMAVAAALDLDQPSTWLMIVGPPSTGKTSIHFPLLLAHPRCVQTSDINLPGLISLAKNRKGQGLLAKVGVRGMWLIKDFGAVLTMRDDKRIELLGALREIYDGRWQRETGLGNETWVGRLNIVAASTSIIERFHRVNAELGDRFLTVRVTKHGGRHACDKAQRQTGEVVARMRAEMEAAARALLGTLVLSHVPTVPHEISDRIYAAAELVALCRTPVGRDSYNRTIFDVGETEGPQRVYQELLSLLIGDAALHGQPSVSEAQLPLLRRLAFDTLPLHRGNIIRQVTPGIPARRPELLSLTRERWEATFDQAAEELVLLGALVRIDRQPFVTYELGRDTTEWISLLSD